MAIVLVVNAGSTSLKLSAVAADDTSVAVDSFDAVPPDVAAVGHRVVHGGNRFTEPVVIDADVEQVIGELTALAPLQNRRALEAIAAARRAVPASPQVAVFDTAFHSTLPARASTYAVPAAWRDDWGIRRLGFHGLSVQWASERVRAPRVVVCHLGGGCSVTAVRDGRSIDTTMGFTPLEGVPMATRAGSVDPGVLIYLQRTARLDVDRIEHELDHQSGLLGLSGISGRVEELERSDSPEAELALDVFTYRIGQAVAAMAIALGGLDALVFTGGVGEQSAFVRRRVCAMLGVLGAELDDESNRTAEPDAEIATASSAVRIHVVRAREDVVVARAARAVLGLSASA